MYDEAPDRYCYRGTSVLKNLLGITDQAALDAYELEASTQRATEPLPGGRFGVRHYLAIHRHLFQDVYGWAGRVRTVRIAKDGSMFCYPEHIAAELRRLFAGLRAAGCFRNLPTAEFAGQAAHFLAELNAIHAFREGNGRTQLSFMTVLAAHAGHPLQHAAMEPGRMLAAMVLSFRGDEAPLRAALAELMAPTSPGTHP